MSRGPALPAAEESRSPGCATRPPGPAGDGAAGWAADLRALLALEWRRERRSPQVVPTMLLFSVGAFVLFRFGLQQDEIRGPLAAGVLLVATLLAALLGVGRLWAAEEDEGGLDAFRLTPAPASALVAAKALALWTFLLALHVVAVPVFLLLLLGASPDAGSLVGLAGVLVLTDLGIAVVGTLVGALAAAARARELLVPLLAVPLLIPLVAAASQAAAPLLHRPGVEGLGTGQGRWWLVLALYDGVFLLVASAVSDGIVED